MGAWGIRAFENDDASDWLYDVEESNDLSIVAAALNVDESGYLEAPEACNALAAAEIVLALQGKPRTGLPENAKKTGLRNTKILIPTI
jgi:hypothetical protein